jgi:hypothetical protein|tara:strand:+ start:383 stop:601 length:219 start_codon:yes stop_codon:yes gene_type:complete
MKKGEIVRVENKDRKFGSQKEYHAVHCAQNGLPVALLLTQNQLDDAVKRAMENQEDIPEITRPTFLQRLFNK